MGTHDTRKPIWVSAEVAARYRAAADAKAASLGRLVHMPEIAVDAIAALEREQAEASKGVRQWDSG